MSADSPPAWRRRGRPHAQLHLPPLTAHEALLLCNLLDRAITAIWRAHGHSMADLLACCDPDAALSSDPTDTTVRSPAPLADDELF